MNKKNKKFGCPLLEGGLVNGNNEFITVAAVIGIDPDNGCPAGTALRAPNKPSKTAQERIEALRKAGVNVDHLFAMIGANGGDCVASNKNGRLVILEDNDPIFNYITDQGTVPVNRLYRRWVMGQMFHMMSYVPYGERQPVGVTQMIHNLGYEYQWKMLMNELYAQMKMERKDAESFADRNRWFHAGVVEAMAEDYIEQLKKRINALPVKRCKRIPYKHIGNKDIFVDDINNKVIHPVRTAIWSITHAKNATQLYNAAKKFNNMRHKLASETPQCKEWVDAYKGAGAFYTMQNLIRFHNCVIFDDWGKRLDKNKSLAFVSAKAEMYKDGQGWCLLGVLKKMLDDNNINIKKKMAEWRKRK